MGCGMNARCREDRSLSPPLDRRAFFSRSAMGLGSVALSAMLHRDSFGSDPPDGRPHFKPRVKSVIWLFMIGGTSHLETFDPKNPLPFASPGSEVFVEEQRREFRLLGELNRMTAESYPHDRVVEARIKSYELAFRMQTSVPQVVDFADETAATRKLYGLDQKQTRAFGEQLLVTRRLVERGVRFVQVYHGGVGGAGAWDQHSQLKAKHAQNCAAVDRPIAGLIKDLKQRGLLDETLIVWATEFGRSPGSQGATGRDHHPFGFSVWLAGGGVKGGTVHGATDDFGFHAIEDRHYVTDIHATLMQQLGLDPRRLDVPGRQRLDIDYGHPIDEIIG